MWALGITEDDKKFHQKIEISRSYPPKRQKLRSSWMAQLVAMQPDVLGGLKF